MVSHLLSEGVRVCLQLQWCGLEQCPECESIHRTRTLAPFLARTECSNSDPLEKDRLTAIGTAAIRFLSNQSVVSIGGTRLRLTT